MPTARRPSQFVSRVTVLSESQRFCHLLAIVDINVQAVPLRDPVFPVAQRLRERLEPMVFAIAPANSMCDLVWLSGFQGVPPGQPRRFEVVRMDQGNPFTFQKFFQCPPGIITEALICIDDFAFARHRTPDQRGDRLDQQAKMMLTLSQSLLCFPPFGDVHYGSGKFD
jgi:hypothetical protein